EMRQDSKNLETATLLYSETECAKKFVAYRDSDADPTDTEKKNSVRCVILAKSKGDELYTRFNDYGGMEAFARAYKVKTKKGKEVEHFDIETADAYFYCKKDEETGNWEVDTKPNLTGKINVAWYSVESHASKLVDKI